MIRKAASVLSMVLLIGCTTLYAKPPTIFLAVPPDGAIGVSPGLTQIRVSFDQDMIVGNHSWVIVNGSFPEMNGDPQWLNSRVAVLNVKLEPNRSYRYGINNEKYNYFQNVHGERVRPVVFEFSTGDADGNSAIAPLTNAENAESIRQLRQAIELKYSYRDFHEVDWDEAFNEHRKALIAASSPAKFSQAAGTLLKASKDAHIWLVADGRTWPSFIRQTIPNVNLSTLSRIVPEWTPRNRIVAIGQFDDDIGYVFIGSWGRKNADDLTVLEEVMNGFEKKKGLIVDVRFNSGGSEPLAQRFAGYFVDQPVVYAQHVNRDTTKPGGFSTLQQRMLQPTEAGSRFQGNVVVLMGSKNMSSAEAFLLMMKQVPGCTLMGESSGGSSGNPKPVSLVNGVTVMLPSWKAMTAEGEIFEGIGLKPDVTVDVKPGDFQQDDPILRKALEHLRASTR